MDVARRTGDRRPGCARSFWTSALVSSHLFLVVTAAALWQSGVLGWPVMTALSALGTAGMGWFVSRPRVDCVPTERDGRSCGRAGRRQPISFTVAVVKVNAVPGRRRPHAAAHLQAKDTHSAG
jgi:hypothetical protein